MLLGTAAKKQLYGYPEASFVVVRFYSSLGDEVKRMAPDAVKTVLAEHENNWKVDGTGAPDGATSSDPPKKKNKRSKKNKKKSETMGAEDGEAEASEVAGTVHHAVDAQNIEELMPSAEEDPTVMEYDCKIEKLVTHKKGLVELEVDTSNLDVKIDELNAERTRKIEELKMQFKEAAAAKAAEAAAATKAAEQAAKEAAAAVAAAASAPEGTESDDDVASVANSAPDRNPATDWLKMETLDIPDATEIARLYDTPEKLVGWTKGVCRMARLTYEQWSEFGDEIKQGATPMVPDPCEAQYATMISQFTLLAGDRRLDATGLAQIGNMIDGMTKMVSDHHGIGRR